MTVQQKQLDDYFQKETDAKRFNGSVFIAREGKILLKKGYGFANYEKSKKNNPSNFYSIGSMTKAFVTISILMLEERGLLNVNDTVHKYIPGFPNSHKITLHQLMNHSSGLYCFLQDLSSPFWKIKDQYHAPEKLLDYIVGHPFDFEPGSQYKYSNSGFVLLGIIIEKVSGMTFGNFIKTNILEPLNMKHTIYDPYETKFRDKIAVGYDHFKESPPPVSDKLHVSVTFSAGGIFSTVGDMYKWDQALYTEKLVSKKSLQRIFTPGHGNYCYGWWLTPLEINGKLHKCIWHWGCSSGYHGMITRLVDDKATIIMLQNRMSPELSVPESPFSLMRLREGITSILFGTDKKGGK